MKINLHKCLKQIGIKISLYTCAPSSELPSNINTMACQGGSVSDFLDGLEVSVDSVLGPGTEGRPAPGQQVI